MAYGDLVAALGRLPELDEVEPAHLFDIEKKAFLVTENAGYRRTALFLIAMLFDRLGRRADGEQPKPGKMYSAICESTISALGANSWTDGTQRLEELVELSWQSGLSH
jgi:hypothetical protein